ncbi:hypothetical protein, variant 1 [Aphanomyces invadans]|uniref:HECT-type E3 ubiquitin transferase n=1 Tax=Aphanomyces invadans TaxID=157072 RepID=A0A024UBQ0_9STRA|nr:hypothetical protein, variant 1 [Aphanomyces invadans]ETW03821.1 hypothetical protein, variant 1 [Aphanomyces invadans]|eukprot:XP_008868050.1 hypothetical protein, variant 1 [Aphanomyces invadans]
MLVYLILSVLIALLLGLILYLSCFVPYRHSLLTSRDLTVFQEPDADVFRENLSDSFMEQQLWKCSVCSFSNVPDKTNCDLCQTTREAKKSKIPSLWRPLFQAAAKTDQASAKLRGRTKSEEQQLNKVQLAAARRNLWRREALPTGEVRWVRLPGRPHTQDNHTAILGDDSSSPSPDMCSSRGSSCMSVGYVRVRDSTGRLVLNESDQVGGAHRLAPRRFGLASAALVVEVSKMPFLNKLKWYSMEIHRLWVPWELGHVEFVVRRDHLVEDSLLHVMRLSPEQLRQRWRVSFMGEPALDAGGVLREWISLLVVELFDPSFGLFVSTASSNHCAWVNSMSGAHQVRHLEYFSLIGRVVGKALFEEQLVPVHFTVPLLKHVLGVPISFSDLQFLDDELYQSLVWLKQCSNPDDVDALMLDFSVTRTTQRQDGKPITTETVPLAPGGESIAVTVVNKAAYLDLLFQYHILDSVSYQLLMFLAAIYSVVPEELLKVFDYKELELLLCGVPTVDVDDWKRHAQVAYLVENTPTRLELQNVSWFWAVLDTFTNEQRAKLLQFVTGSSRVPAQGFKALISTDGRVQPFKLSFCPMEHLYPRAHTCFNRLDLPLYESKSEMHTYLIAVLSQDATGFSME